MRIRTGVATVLENLDGKVVDVAVRRTEVLGLDTEDFDEGGLDLLKLLRDAVVVELGDVGVRPSVRADNVAVLVEPADLVDVLLVVDAAVVVACELDHTLVTEEERERAGTGGMGHGGRKRDSRATCPNWHLHAARDEGRAG